MCNIKMNSIRCFIVIVALGTVVSGVPFASSVESNEINTDSDFVSGLNKCAFQPNSDGIATCATERIVRSLDLLANQANINIWPGISLLSDGPAPSFRSGKQLKEEIEETKSNDGSMLELIGNATARFFSGRTLKVKLPNSEEIGRALEEGRKRMGGNKNKGGLNMGMMGIGAAVAGLVPLFLAKIALITAKALIVGKIALVLAGILLVQMLMKNNNNHHVDNSWSSAQPVYGPPANTYNPPSNSYGVPSAQYPYSRSFTVEEEKPKYSQELAYSAQMR
ncbi:unnamed protein product [Ceutorhynchus assimilis]|uniref:Uncharacterized protein n=1 Tax=Ceutorhynchus assimilis TaxID=467358 RepID=A0A9N9MEL2_9CUCU|nr:unnamed protein product [Ceutorhynchus assimilis]